MNEAAAVTAYTPLARRVAREFFAPGADHEDVEQEALIGLLLAVRAYRQEAETPFAQFAAVVIRRRVLTFVKWSQRAKHKPLSESVRALPDPEGIGQLASVDVLPDPRVEALVEDRERLRNVFAEMAELSPLEKRCVVGFACGLSYEELHRQTGRHAKAIDNALVRGRAKLRRVA